MRSLQRELGFRRQPADTATGEADLLGFSFLLGGALGLTVAGVGIAIVAALSG